MAQPCRHPRTPSSPPDRTSARCSAASTNDIRSKNDKGVDFAQAGDKIKARESFIAALMLDPGNPLTLWKKGDNADAKKHADRAAKLGRDAASLLQAIEK